MRFSFKKTDYSLNEGLNLEWLETNGIGGYASSTCLNCNTRKYHGLLVAKLENLPEKYVLLSNIEDVITIGDSEYWLNVVQYPGHLHRLGYDCLQEFSIDTHPVFTYQMKDVVLSKEILMLQQENSIFIKYRLVSGANKAKISLRPFIAFRNFHSLSKENSFIKAGVKDCQNGKRFAPYEGMPEIFMQVDAQADFTPTQNWYKNFEYKVESERGFDYHEDLFSCGVFSTQFGSGEIIFSFSLQEQSGDLAEKWQAEVRRRKELQKEITGSDLQKQLKITAQTFFQNSSSSKDFLAVIAGYHWFDCWGRDAMISLPGMTLYSGREELCLKVLRTFAAQEKQGLIPNFLGATTEQNAYNTVDASLWFGWAVQQYYLATNNLENINNYLLSTLKNIFLNYRAGTLYNIKMQENGLLYAGDSSTNLTWMDAQVGGVPVTPRYGLQVEINALWFNLVCFLQELTDLAGDPMAQELKLLAKQIKISFNEVFWDENLGYLKDYVVPDSGHQDLAIRPNQIFAVSLPFSPLTKEAALQTMQTVNKYLLTPYGLRTLAPQDSNYIGNYSGGSVERDHAYHNGTVWPWLLGHFSEGMIKVVGKQQATKIIAPCVAALTEHLKTFGIGSIAEIFDGNEPHKPNGCISQAWSVAEILRLTYLISDEG